MENEKDKDILNEDNPKNKKDKMSSKKIKVELEEKQNELKELEDKYIRLFAEFENYKKRVRKENELLIGTASENVLKSLLPVLDDFRRAKLMSDDENSSEHFTEGVSLVYDKLFSTLKSIGLEEINCAGQVFNPEEHDAIAEIPVQNDDQKNKIIDIVENGYKLNNKIIRFPKVVVGK
ncbi:MAG: nucleotide exchange factor GrpE [Saprospiraceae bacterium]